jgi:hypothetical protein
MKTIQHATMPRGWPRVFSVLFRPLAVATLRARDNAARRLVVLYGPALIAAGVAYAFTPLILTILNVVPPLHHAMVQPHGGVVMIRAIVIGAALLTIGWNIAGNVTVAIVAGVGWARIFLIVPVWLIVAALVFLPPFNVFAIASLAIYTAFHVLAFAVCLLPGVRAGLLRATANDNVVYLSR